MQSLVEYTDQQSRMCRAFSYGGTLCSTTCQACDRTYFVTSPGHGDYDEGELENLRELAEQSPDKYIEVPDFDSVSTMTMPTDRKHVVVGCICDPTKALSEFIEANAEELTRYLREYWQDVRADAAMEERKATEALSALGWMPMNLAPKTAKWITVQDQDGQEKRAHWASDLSGEEQPPFEGWFTESGREFVQIFPIQWRPLDSDA